MKLAHIRPSTYFIVGQVSSLIPYLFPFARVFEIYQITLDYHLVIITIYAAILFWLIDRSLSFISIKRIRNHKNIIIPNNNLLIGGFAICSIILQLIVYGGSPLIKIIIDPMQVVSINNKINDIPGILGFALILNQLILFILLLNNKKLKKITLFIMIFALIMNAKRQMIFILFIIFYSKKEISLKKLTVGVVGVLTFFSIVGLLRGSRNIFEPILFYLSFSAINFTSAVSQVPDLIRGTSGMLASFEISLPTLLRGQNTDSIISFAEPTAGVSLVGGSFLVSGFAGLTIYVGAIACFTHLLWRQAFSNKWLCSIYVFSIWPLIASNTYNLFNNLSMFWLPILAISIALSVLPKRKVDGPR